MTRIVAASGTRRVRRSSGAAPESGAEPLAAATHGRATPRFLPLMGTPSVPHEISWVFGRLRVFSFLISGLGLIRSRGQVSYVGLLSLSQRS